MGDLRRKTGSYALQWRRSSPFFLTCANIPLYLRQHTPIPAPTYPYTCAKIHRDLRQKAKKPMHLRHVVKNGSGERDEKGYHPPIRM